MVVSISGAQCSGKTTLINALKECGLFGERTAFMGSPSRKANDQGIAINKAAGTIDQLWIVSTYVKELIETCNNRDVEHIISDRCVLDMLCYIDYHVERAKGVTRHHWENVREVTFKILCEVEELYDCHILVEPEFELVPDGVRSIDPEFQKKMVYIFKENMMSLSDLYPGKVVHITGNVEGRLNAVLRLFGMKQ